MSSTTDSKPLNQGQLAAAEGFFDSLFDPNQKELIISGPGGVGKTHTMSHMIDVIMPQYLEACEIMGVKPHYDEVVMTATTNKAAEVMAQATGRPTSTIQSHLNLTVKNDYVTGESKLIPVKGRWEVKSNKIIFVDESSMIDTALWNYIKDGHEKSKIVYVGDHAQLGPIKEGISPIYNQGIPMFQLTQPMRTNKPELLELNQHFRDIVEGKKDWGAIKLFPGVIDWVDDDGMEKLLKAEFQQGHANRVLAYSNKRVQMYNDHLREQNGFTGEFHEFEPLVSNSACKFGSMDRLSVEQECTITSRANLSENIRIDADVYLEVRRCTIDTGYGGLIHNVPVPINRAHYDQLIKYYSRTKNWERYYHLKENYPDLRAKDASTVHKAQGSSYGTVFIDLSDLSTCHNPETAARLFYVAVSRARNRVVFYGQLAAKYGQLVH